MWQLTPLWLAQRFCPTLARQTIASFRALRGGISRAIGPSSADTAAASVIEVVLRFNPLSYFVAHFIGLLVARVVVDSCNAARSVESASGQRARVTMMFCLQYKKPVTKGLLRGKDILAVGGPEHPWVLGCGADRWGLSKYRQRSPNEEVWT